MKSRLVKELMEQRLYIAGLGLIWLAMPLMMSDSRVRPVLNLDVVVGARYAAQWLLFHMVAVGAFSAEFHHGTVTFQMAQPISRREIWIEKFIAALFVIMCAILAELLGWGLWGPSGAALGWGGMKVFGAPPSSVTAIAPCAGLLALGGGCLFGVTIRRTFTGLLAALLAPAVIATLLIGLSLAFLSEEINTAVTQRLTNSFGPAGVFVFLAFVWFAITFPLGWIAFKRMEV